MQQYKTARLLLASGDENEVKLPLKNTMGKRTTRFRKMRSSGNNEDNEPSYFYYGVGVRTKDKSGYYEYTGYDDGKRHSFLYAFYNCLSERADEGQPRRSLWWWIRWLSIVVAYTYLSNNIINYFRRY